MNNMVDKPGDLVQPWKEWYHPVPKDYSKKKTGVWSGPIISGNVAVRVPPLTTARLAPQGNSSKEVC